MDLFNIFQYGKGSDSFYIRLESRMYFQTFRSLYLKMGSQKYCFGNVSNMMVAELYRLGMHQTSSISVETSLSSNNLNVATEYYLTAMQYLTNYSNTNHSNYTITAC